MKKGTIFPSESAFDFRNCIAAVSSLQEQIPKFDLSTR